MKTFRDKVVVVTGVGSGIGKALAIQLDSLGAKLAINDYDKSSLDATNAVLKQDTYCEDFDVADKEAFYRFAENVYNHYGQVDCIINNAGVALSSVSTENLSYNDFDWIMGINFWGMVYGTKAFLPYIKKQTEGSITNVSSIFGITGIAYQTAYCTTKFAIRGFTESLRMEMHHESPHVIISSVHPGGIKTNIARSSKTPEGHEATDEKVFDEMMEEIDKAFITSPEKAADVIITGIMKKKERILIGPDATRADRIVRLFPSKYTDIILKHSSFIAPEQKESVSRKEDEKV